MRTWKNVRPLLAGLMVLSLAACGVEGEDAGEATAEIINGTLQNLGANSFVRFPTAGCTGSLVTNQWAMSAVHCPINVGDQVTMDNQVTTVSRVVFYPDSIYGVGVSMVQLASPFTVGGSTSFRRGLRSSVAPLGSSVRCFGYGHLFNGDGIDPVLRMAWMNVVGNASNVYTLAPQTAGQGIAPGDFGGFCLDDMGYAVTAMGTYFASPASAGGGYGIVSTYVSDWVDRIVTGQCTVSADCATGICAIYTHQCVTSYCQDGLKDHGETGVDCGGPCNHCVSACPPGYRTCGGDCVKTKFCP
jgi:hypothetical protein